MQNLYKKVTDIIDETLGENRKVIDIEQCIITETNSPTTHLEISYYFNDPTHENSRPIQAYGDGFVDGLVNGLVSRFEDDYKSLKNLKLSRYEVSAKIKKNHNSTAANASVSVELGIKTPTSNEILFIENDVSVVRASTKIVRNAIQFMINCEEAVRIIHFCLQDAKNRGRIDVVDKYTDYLVELVKITSYESVLN